MVTKEVKLTIDENELEQMRALVEAGTASSDEGLWVDEVLGVNRLD